MADGFDLDELDRVFAAYPWLLPLLRDAEWWRREDGGGGFRVDVDDLEAHMEGFRALAAATGVRFVEQPVRPPRPDRRERDAPPSPPSRIWPE
ncbi:hypothetical protein [Salsipaludibacter albus]|uniref:hypothetical protein n=1 Tax=Salsipaludibacter albus TaxID=2849650 RepID=UPI001EE4198C|nr:hypothetical protein [Salsipaludibacter albus]MBY5162133.1 hypothetical protein [Salsipaludibacter albus]